MMNNQILEYIQRRVSNASIGSSTLRNAGAKGVVDEARKYCAGLDLSQLNGMNKKQYDDWLNKNTRNLCGNFTGGAYMNWGAARKALNVFMEEAFYNRLLSKNYGLRRLENCLEVPLDSNVVRGLKKNCPKRLPRWKGIKNLSPNDSYAFQAGAKQVAQNEGVPIVYLDLLYWRERT